MNGCVLNERSIETRWMGPGTEVRGRTVRAELTKGVKSTNTCVSTQINDIFMAFLFKDHCECLNATCNGHWTECPIDSILNAVHYSDLCVQISSEIIGPWCIDTHTLVVFRVTTVVSTRALGPIKELKQRVVLQASVHRLDSYVALCTNKQLSAQCGVNKKKVSPSKVDRLERVVTHNGCSKESRVDIVAHLCCLMQNESNHWKHSLNGQW